MDRLLMKTKTKTKITLHKIKLGRNKDCEIILDHPSISRYHAEIIYTNKSIEVKDLNSRNGTFIQKSDKRIKISGELIVGDTLLSFGDLKAKKASEYIEFFEKNKEKNNFEMLAGTPEEPNIEKKYGKENKRCKQCAAIIPADIKICTQCGGKQ